MTRWRRPFHSRTRIEPGLIRRGRAATVSNQPTCFSAVGCTRASKPRGPGGRLRADRPGRRLQAIGEDARQKRRGRAGRSPANEVSPLETKAPRSSAARLATASLSVRLLGRLQRRRGHIPRWRRRDSRLDAITPLATFWSNRTDARAFAAPGRAAMQERTEDPPIGASNASLSAGNCRPDRR